MTRGSEKWPATAAHPPDGEEDDAYEEPPLPQMCWEYVMACLSAMDTKDMSLHNVRLRAEAMRWDRSHAAYLRGDGEDAA